MGPDATPDVAELRRLAGRVAAESDRRDVLDLDARIDQLERRVDGLPGYGTRSGRCGPPR